VRVLIADDDEATRETLGEFLSGEGFEVVGDASDGEAAVKQVLRLRPEVVLMDLRMSGMDGLEATAVIKATFPGIQVVILTAFSDPESSRTTELAGAAHFVEKDGPPSALVDAVRAAAVAARDPGS
jgi:DNA-binding NarL/FixJ family response regulator